MTGATAGIGWDAAQGIAKEPDTTVLVGARGSGRTVPEGCELLPLDLMSLDSVRAFAEAVKERLGEGKIDALVLNAGLQNSDPTRRTPEGFEVTFGVNHLAHYLLARLLLPVIADGGRLVITTSDTHDPKIIPIAPITLDPQALAHPRVKSTRMRAYAASKLCNLLTARSFAALDGVVERDIAVVAYNPGLTPGTGIVGDLPPAVEAARASTPDPADPVQAGVLPGNGRARRAGARRAHTGRGNATGGAGLRLPGQSTDHLSGSLGAGPRRQHPRPALAAERDHDRNLLSALIKSNAHC
jgi:NAD(P)-dependent dehydrogenase (short-subunit alcohol dehydrogenase family)